MRLAVEKGSGTVEAAHRQGSGNSKRLTDQIQAVSMVLSSRLRKPRKVNLENLRYCKGDQTKAPSGGRLALCLFYVYIIHSVSALKRRLKEAGRLVGCVLSFFSFSRPPREPKHSCLALSFCTDAMGLKRGSYRNTTSDSLEVGSTSVPC